MYHEDEDGVYTTPTLKAIDHSDMVRVGDYLAKYGSEDFWYYADKGCYTENEKFWAIVWIALV